MHPTGFFTMTSGKMETTVRKSQTPTGKESDNPFDTPNERLGFQVEDLKVLQRNQNCLTTRNRRCQRDSNKEKIISDTQKSTSDMNTSRSCRFRLSVPVMFWTTAFLILLARGVDSARAEQSRFSRSPKYEQETDAQGGLITPNMQETYIMQLLRELMQQQRASQQNLQVNSNGEDLSDGQIDWRKVPLPLLYQIRSIINDGSKEEDKRGSYMSLCHFKICNLG